MRTWSLLFVFLSAISFSQTSGALFVNTNQTTNQVWSYTRASDGTLAFAGAFDTQGKGSASELGSQNAVILSPNRQFLFVVNAASDEITSFSVQPNAQLTFVSKVSSGGRAPISLSVSGNFLYVLNSSSPARINAFTIGPTGALTSIAGSARRLSVSAPKPAQVQFSNNGSLLVVAERMTSKLDTFTVAANGLATGPNVQNSSGIGPFGFAFDSAGHLIVSEVRASAVSSYSVSSSGTISVITGSLRDFGQAACWIANTANSSFPTQYSYTTNTGSSTISGFAIAANGSLSLLNANGKTFILPNHSDPLDEVISDDNNYLYVLEGTYGGVVGLRIGSDGSLAQVTAILGTPSTSYGMAGY
ncbi:MAG TPA: beta-propeller fold lactonase family protein [Gemmatimonadales bacterium]|nr:beta-propeller fold lactonase family protein [Gemmatimonadales bacterium]